MNYTIENNNTNLLTENHWQEWVIGSGIDPAIVALNVRSLTGNEIYEYLLYALPQTARRNDGRLRDKYLRQYAHAEAGGWWVSGLDPLNNWQQMDWGRLKPDSPRREWDKCTNKHTEKTVKYESPPKTSNRVTYFNVPNCIWNKVAQRYNIKRYDSQVALRLCDRLHPLLFWEWVQRHPQIPIILCEGEKKAACLLSLGFVAIALPGIWNGRVGKKDFDERLHPDLVAMAQPGRKFIILFDYETKLKTRWSVFQAIVRTGKTILAAGCSAEVASLPGPEKGVDDFVIERGKALAQKNRSSLINPHLNKGFSRLSNNNSTHFSSHRGAENVNALLTHCPLKNEAGFKPPEKSVGITRDRNKPASFSSCETLVTAIIDDAKTLKDYQHSYYRSFRGLSNKYKPDIRVNVKYLSDSVNLPKSGLVGLCSDMGTGKTELMRKWREQHPQERFLNNGHRVNLLKNLGQRLYTQMYSDLGYVGLAKATALSITIDSLHKLNTDSLKYGCIFIDEACQYLTHLLHSNTCKEHRASILEVLQYIVYNTPLVVIADAHLDDVTVDFFRAMRPKGEEPFIIKNDWKNGGRTIYWYEGNNSSALVAQISAALMSGQKIMVVSDSKRFIKKLEYSLLNRGIECRLEKEVWEEEEEGEPENRREGDPPPIPPVPPLPPSPPLPPPHCKSLKIWSIHSDNSGSEENVAFIKDITNAVKSLDALFTSPSLGTGVDIADYHFDAVFGAFHAVSQTATECAQQLYRYRPIVPIHVWVAPRPPFGYLDTNASKLKQRLLQTNEITAFLLRIDPLTGKRGAEKDWALEAYCQIQANRNQSINNLRADLRELLTDMGNTIVPMGTDDDNDAIERLKNAAHALDLTHYCAVASANDISASDYRNRQTKDYLKPTEVFECEKFRIRDAYGMEVTESLVEKDDGGSLIRAIASLEAILSQPEGRIVDPITKTLYPVPPTIVTDKDIAQRNKLPLCMDWGNYSARWLARFNLGLHGILKRLVAGGEITATDPDLIKMTEIAKHCQAHVKAILGFRVPPNCQPIWLLATLVEQLGLKLAFHKVGPRAQQVKYYFLSAQELEFALFVIAHRQSKRHQKQQQTSAKVPFMYGVSPTTTTVSTPPHNCIGEPHWQGVDTTDSMHEINPADIDFQPPDNPALINACAEQLRQGILHGVEEIKSILKRWSEHLRWSVVLLLEENVSSELRCLEQLAPQFYEWLKESILPMEGA